MRVKDSIILYFSVWALISALFAPSIDLFFTLLLIGFLIFIEIGDFFIDNNSKEVLKSFKYVLIAIFVFIVVDKIKTILVK
jgi:hypothetical protein